MWKEISHYFKEYPKQKTVALTMLELGLKVKSNRIYCGPIELSPSKIARALHVDRRAVSATIQTISNQPQLRKIFSKLMPTCHLKDVASEMQWGVIEIIPTDPSLPGILADVATIIADNNISVRQAIVDDVELSEEPRLFIITEMPIPGSLLPAIRKAKGVKALIMY
jgi:predicted regulator of amino acid metabolism with ACT domain